MNPASSRRPPTHLAMPGALALAGLVGALWSPGFAWAQDPPPAASASAPATLPPVPSAPRQAFVLMAMTGEEAVDQHLRATADELNRRLGARGFRDVEPARVGQAIAAEPTAIGTLRSRLGAAFSIRVDIQSRTPESVTLLVVTQSDAGERSVQVEAVPKEIPARVVAAVEPLLPAAPGAATPALDRVVLDDGSSVDCYVIGIAPGNHVAVRTKDGLQQTIPWARVRQIIPHAGGQPTGSGWSWAQQTQKQESAPVKASERGGSLLTFDVQAQLVGTFVYLHHPYYVQYPEGQSITFTGDSLSGGGGGGVGLHVGYLQLWIPDPAESGPLFGLHLGTGIDLAAVAFGYRTDSKHIIGQRQGSTVLIADNQEGGETEWASASVFMMPLALGGQVGLGNFTTPTSWRGVMLGLDWRPTYTYMNPSGLGSMSSFNYLGIEAHVDIATLDLAEPGPEANFRISMFYLPPIDRNAAFASLGFGAVWY